MKPIKNKTCKHCGNSFKPFKTTDKYCCFKCASANHKPISNKSKKQKELDNVYNQLRKIFLSKPENKTCPVTNEPTTEIHHKKGRTGYLLLHTPLWLAVSREGHIYIHDHPEESYKKGWLIRSTII